jgi:hypothetical protein
MIDGENTDESRSRRQNPLPEFAHPSGTATVGSRMYGGLRSLFRAAAVLHVRTAFIL